MGGDLVIGVKLSLDQAECFTLTVETFAEAFVVGSIGFVA